MHRLRLLTFVAPLVSALACHDATSPPRPAGPEIRALQRTPVIPSTSPQVSAGGTHTCALKTDGTVVCWGWNSSGQATVPAGLTSVAQVSAGGEHTCALKTDGTVVCWGDNGDGQATVPGGLTSVAQVSAGETHTCALKTDGTVVCWGDNFFGQTTVPAGLASVAQVSAGLYHTCALKTDGTVVCWGYSDPGQTTVPAGLASVAQVSAGGLHTCALKTDGTVVCWGDNSFGETTVPGGLNLIANAAQSITFTSTPPSPALTGGTYTVAATGGASGNAVTFSSLTASICTVSGSTVSLVAVGSCTVAADQAAGNGYAAAPQVTQVFTISATQSITFTSTPPSPALIGGTYTVAATGGASGNAVTFSSLTAPICTVSGSTVSLVAVGSCTIAANQAAGGNYLAATEQTQTFTVADEEPPTLSVPADFAVNATSPAGAVVTYAVSASDNVAVAGLTCSPASGTGFPIGTTTVTCVATDPSGNQTSRTFHVTVLNTQAQISNLETTLANLGLPSGTATSLTTKLDAALAAANAGDVTTACAKLQAFINETQAQAGKRKISQADATALIAEAQRIRAVLGC